MSLNVKAPLILGNQKEVERPESRFSGWFTSKESNGQAGGMDSIPESGRSPGEEMATHSSILAWRIPMERGAWWATVHGLAKSQT